MRLALLALSLLACGETATETETDAPVDAAAPSPTPLRFRFEVQNDVDESLYLQVRDQTGRQDWVRLYRDGERLTLEPYPDVDLLIAPAVLDVTGGTHFGRHDYAWDGQLWTNGAPAPAPAGAYEAEFCFGAAVTVGGRENDLLLGQAEALHCTKVPFDHPRPSGELVFTVLGG